MADINSYTNELLLDFVDEFHVFLKRVFSGQHGERWFEVAIEPTLYQLSVARTREMLDSPMRVVDMGKDDDEIYGIEHLWGVLEKHWRSDMESIFGDRTRTQTYLSEMTELRHNVSHRRAHHYLSRAEVVRFLQNAKMLLACIRSPKEAVFQAQIDLLLSAGTPWGTELIGRLPPADRIVNEFIGRPSQRKELVEWLADPESQQILVWGYGGAGKSALAYQFARDAKDAAPASLRAIVWLSAKRVEYVEGGGTPIQADFTDIDSLVLAFWEAFYGEPLVGASRQDLLAELRQVPSLIVVDDLDTVLDQIDLARFLLYDLPAVPGAKVVYTSRQRVPGLRMVDVDGFVDAELDRFIRQRAFAHGLPVEECLSRRDAIQSVTSGYPLFVDDLLRLARLDGLKGALESWTQRKGDGAREYALRRQLESLGDVVRDVLIAAAVAERPVSNLEIAGAVGFVDSDVDAAINELQNWKLLNRAGVTESGRGLYSCNQNTQRLVLKTYTATGRIEAFRSAFRFAIAGAVPRAMYGAIARAIGDATQLVQRDDIDGAITLLNAARVGDLEKAPDLWGTLGWVYSRRADDPESLDAARRAFHQAHLFNSRKEDTYYHWTRLELDAAEHAIAQRLPDLTILDHWHAAARAAEYGIERCETKALRGLAAYAHTRAARTQEILRRFNLAQSEWAQAEVQARRGFLAPPSARSGSPDLYTPLVRALEGQEKSEDLLSEMRAWRDASDRGDAWRFERDRMSQRFPELRQL